MALSFTNVKNDSAYTFIADVTCLDNDVSGAVLHGLSGTPLSLTLTMISNSVNNYSGWAISANSTALALTKNNVVSSGGTTPGTTKVLRVRASLPHSIT